MATSEHIYNPESNSLEARISAYRTVHEAWLNAEASLKFMDDEAWSDSLGDRADIEKAYKISARSLQMAADNITQEEIQTAMSQGTIDASEAQGFTQHKRREEMQSIRDGQSFSDSSEYGNKQ